MEGVFSGIATYCGSGAVIVCSFCGDGIDYKDILAAQNMTLLKIQQNHEELKRLEVQIADLTAEAVQRFKLTQKAMRKAKKYEEVLRQTEQILYW